MAQSAEHILGKDEVVRSNRINSSRKPLERIVQAAFAFTKQLTREAEPLCRPT